MEQHLDQEQCKKWYVNLVTSVDAVSNCIIIPCLVNVKSNH